MSRLFLRINRDIKLDRPLKAELNRVVNASLKKASGQIRKKLKELIVYSMAKDSTLNSIVSGQLKHDFGLTTELATTSANGIIKYLIEGLSIEVKPSSGLLSLSVDFSPDLEEISRLPFASYTSEGGDVPWLYWLLNRGTEIINKDYAVVGIPGSEGKSRSGGGFFMLAGAGVFRVLPQFAGTSFDNFITRFMEKHEPDMIRIFQEEILRGFE